MKENNKCIKCNSSIIKMKYNFHPYWFKICVCKQCGYSEFYAPDKFIADYEERHQ